MSDHFMGLPFRPGSPDAVALLRNLKWQALKPPPAGSGEDVYATHQGVLKVPGLPPMRIYQLNDGRRVIESDDIANYLVTPDSSATRAREEGET